MVDRLKFRFFVVALLLAGVSFVARDALAVPVSQSDASTICSLHGGLEDWGAGRTGCKWCETVKVHGKSQTTCHEVQCSLSMAANITCHYVNIRGAYGQGIVAPNAGFSPSGIFTSPPHRGPVMPRPPHGGVKNPGGGTPPKGHRPPVYIGGFKPPSGIKTPGGNSGPVIYRGEAHHSGGHR